MLWKRFKSNKKGVTLIELIVAMALTVIVLTASTRIMMPMFRLYNENLRQSNAIRVSAEIEQALRNKLTSAIEMSIAEDETLDAIGKNYNYLYIKNGRIVYEENINDVPYTYDLISEEAYEGFDVEWIIRPEYIRLYTEKENELFYNELKIDVTLNNEADNVSVTREIAIQLINMIDKKDFFFAPQPNTPGMSRIYISEPQAGLTVSYNGTSVQYDEVKYEIQVDGQITGEIIVETADGEFLYEGPRSIYEGVTGPKKVPNPEIDYKSIRFRSHS